MKSTRGSLLASANLSIVVTLTNVPVPACVMVEELPPVATCISPSFSESASCKGITLVTLFRSRLALSFAKLLGSGSKA